MNNCLIRNVIKRKCPAVRKYEMSKNAIIFTDEEGKKFVAKKNNNVDILNTYKYLHSRGFDYLPKIAYSDNDGYIYEYEENMDMPLEQKISDLIKITALLHNKTCYYKNICIDEVKELYESLNDKISDVFSYYDNLINIIDSKIYPSPSQYMLSRNCSSIFSCLNFCKTELDAWYDIIKEKKKIREVFLHNNLEYDHIIRNNESILISWDKAKSDIPIYDFIKLYKNNYSKYDFNNLYREYISRFPLLEEEKKLLFILLFMPDKIEFIDNELINTINVSKLCNYLFVTDKLFMENKTKYSEE